MSTWWLLASWTTAQTRPASLGRSRAAIAGSRVLCCATHRSCHGGARWWLHHRDSGTGQFGFHLRDGQGAEVEHACRQHRVGPGVDRRGEVRGLTGAAGGDEWDGDFRPHHSQQLSVIPVTGAIAVDGVEQNLPHPAADRLLSPGNGVDPGAVSPSHGGHFVSRGRGSTSQDVHRQDENVGAEAPGDVIDELDRKSTRLNSSHVAISYAVFCLKKKIPGTRSS